jgi:hypothetical protein
MQLSRLVKVCFATTPSSGRAVFSNVRNNQDVICFVAAVWRGFKAFLGHKPIISMHL